MKPELHILTSDDELSQDLGLAGESNVFDLTVPEPDYGQLLEKIFEAERIHVW